MAETLTIGGVDRTANLKWDSLRVEQAAGEFSAVCSFVLKDADASLTVTTRDAVVVADNGTTLFSGEVVDVDDDLLSLALDGRWLTVTCRDYNALVEEAVIDTEESYSAEPDSDIIDDLFNTYRADIDSTTHVSTIDASMDFVFLNITLRQALDEICNQTGGRWYVDEDKKLHYFSTEANVAAFFLSDTPDNASSFPYQSIRRRTRGHPLVNQVLVVGDQVSDWYEDAASIAAYGERPGPIISDSRLASQDMIDDRGAAILADYAQPRVKYEVITRKDGLRAGMDVRIVCGAWGVDETLTIRRLTMFWRGDHRFYQLELGDGVATALTSGRVWIDRLGTVESSVLEIDGTVFDTDPPGTPTFLAGNLSTGTDIDGDGHQVVYIQATWGAVGDADLSYYTIQGSTSNDFSGYTMTRNHPSDGDRIERFVPVVGNTVYYFRVRAVDWVGNASPWSTTRNITSATDTSAPAQVVGLVAAGARTLIGLNWTANSEADLREYEIQRADDSGGAPGAWATIAFARLNFYIDQDFTDGEIDAEDTFWYRVRAIDTSDNEGAWSAQTDGTLSKVTGDHIAANTITAVHIAAGSITATELNVAELSAISADLGTVTAGTVTGATFRTSAAGARIVIDAVDGIQAYNIADTQTFSLLPSGAGWIGTAASIAWNTAGGVTIDGGLLVDGTIVATAFTNEIGGALFSVANGILLLGPYREITATSWASTRGQAATIAGAFHTEAGAWPGAAALVIEEATTNYVLDSSFEHDTVGDYWNNSGCTTFARSDTRAVRGEYSLHVVTDAAADFVYSDTIADADGGETWTASCWVWIVSGDFRLQIQENDAGWSAAASVDETFIGGWQWMKVTATLTAGVTDARIVLTPSSTAASEWYVDCVQFEQQDHPTTYADGSLGTGYSFSGDDHESTSSRTATTVNLDAYAGGLSSLNTITFRCVVQPLYDADDDWPSAASAIFDVRGASNNQRILLSYRDTDDKFTVYVHGSVIAESDSAQAFKRGDALDVVLTVDFTNDEYYLYVNGEEDCSATDSLSAQVYTDWTLGARIDDTQHGNWWFTEYAVLGTVLGADEVAALYVMNRPLVDAGATNRPGIYLWDGQFTLASRSTGARVQIDVDGIQAYSSSAQSVAIDTDGDARFGSNISAAATTALAVFATAQTYNSESIGAGDVLLGDNSANKANMLWDVSEGQLIFRTGTTTTLYIDTDGSLTAGGGYIKLNQNAHLFFDVSTSSRGIVWKDDFDGGDDDVGYIQVATGTYDMTISTGGDDIAGWQNFTIQTRSSSGTTRNPFYIDAANQVIGMYQSSPAGTLHVRQNDASGAIPVLVLEQDDADAPYIRFLDATIYTGKSAADEYVKVQLGAADRFIRVYT